jgi:tetratricopeptide (TPR) repeat protein
MKRLTTVFAFLAVFAGVALAARDDDFDFAQKLVERKYYDLAKEQFQKIISDAGSTEQKANGELGLALLLKAQAGDIQADSRREPKEILGVFSAAEDRFDQFLKTYPNHPKRTEAQFEVGNLLRMKGTYLARLVEKLPDQADEYRKAADDAFSQAMDLFNQVVSNFKVRIAAVKNEGKDPDPDLEFTYQKARYFYDVTHYDKGILYPEKSSERRGLLDKACTLLDNFIWDNETNLL